MMHNLTCAFLCATLCTTAAFAQVTEENATATQSSTEATGTTPAAWVYVSSTPAGSSVSQIEAFVAAPNGKLTPMADSPFKENVSNMAVNGKYLFGTAGNGNSIDAYWMEGNGALTYSATTNTALPGDCNPLGPLFLDHTGATLYDMEFRGDDCLNNTFVSFTVNKPSGKVKNIGNSTASDWLSLPASFIGNNVFAYSASCLGDMYWGIYGFKRGSSGLLTEISLTAAPPKPPTGYFYCPSQAAADPANHVAISMQPVNQLTFDPDKPPQLASYTADSKGNLSTTSTSANMPPTAVVDVTDLGMSPSGLLLAVSGSGGLQVFHFNGPKPITHDTGLLTTAEVDQLFWDNQNHLYAIGRTSNKLWVFTVTPTSYVQAPGSPYTINAPIAIIVQPMPRY